MVMIADRIAAGLQVGFQAMMVAAIPVTCGQAMEVPETSLNDEGFWPWGISESLGIHDARMLTPGAATSGCKHKSPFSLPSSSLEQNFDKKDALVWTKS